MAGQPQIYPFYALPPETLEQLLMMLLIAQGQASMQEYISKLPTWDNLHETQTPPCFRQSSDGRKRKSTAAKRTSSGKYKIKGAI